MAETLREAVRAFVDADDAAQREDDRAEQPGARVWTSKFVVRRSRALTALRAALATSPAAEPGVEDRERIARIVRLGIMDLLRDDVTFGAVVAATRAVADAVLAGPNGV